MRMLTWLDGQLAYERACEVLAELSGVTVSVSSNWRVAQSCGSAMQAALAAEEEAQKAQARAWSTPGEPPRPDQRMGLALDGAMLNLREEGWKEFKLGCVYGVEPETRVDERSGDVGQFGHAVECSYTAHLGGPEPFGWMAWTEAQRRGWSDACATQLLGDGAVWNWNLQQEHFPTSQGVVDWYHAAEHLGQAMQLLYPEGGAQATRWYNEHEETLYQGHAERIARDLAVAAAQERDPQRATELHTAAGYFKNNRDRMHYHDYRVEGWPIGSGMVESGAKQFKARVTGAGMRWSRAGAATMLTLCAAALTSRERFDNLWSAAYRNLPPS